MWVALQHLALQRMNEILGNKARQCREVLKEARVSVQNEVAKLDENVDRSVEEVRAQFDRARRQLDAEESRVLANVRRTHDEKRSILQAHLSQVEHEEEELQRLQSSVQFDMDIRSITRKIADLNSNHDSLRTLVEPRENAFLQFEPDAPALERLGAHLKLLGRVRVSTTYPALCYAHVLSALGVASPTAATAAASAPAASAGGPHHSAAAALTHRAVAPAPQPLLQPTQTQTRPASSATLPAFSTQPLGARAPGARSEGRRSRHVMLHAYAYEYE